MTAGGDLRRIPSQWLDLRVRHGGLAMQRMDNEPWAVPRVRAAAWKQQPGQDAYAESRLQDACGRRILENVPYQQGASVRFAIAKKMNAEPFQGYRR